MFLSNVLAKGIFEKNFVCKRFLFKIVSGLFGDYTV